MKIWIRAKLGGDSQTDRAREFGYADASGIHRVVQRLEARAKRDPTLARRLKRLRAAVDN